MYDLLTAGMSASRVGGSLMPAWAAQGGKVPHRVTSIKFLEYQKFCTSNVVTLSQIGKNTAK